MTKRVAFFDMDGTLMGANSARIYAISLWKDNEISTFQLVSIGWLLLRYKFGAVDMERVMARFIRQGQGQAEEPMIQRCRRLVDQQLEAHIFPEARARVVAHQQAGDRVVILTASSSYIAEPIGALLGIQDVLATPIHVTDGLFTGQFEEPVCYGHGKRVWAERFCESEGYALEDAAFYTDSVTDLPVLDVVGEPRVVNPDLRLDRLAKRRGWSVEHWTL